MGVSFEEEFFRTGGTRIISHWSHGAGVSLPLPRLTDLDLPLSLNIDAYRGQRIVELDPDVPETHAPFGFSFSVEYAP